MKDSVTLYHHWYDMNVDGTTLIYLRCKKLLANDAGKFTQSLPIPSDIPPQIKKNKITISQSVCFFLQAMCLYYFHCPSPSWLQMRLRVS